MKVTKTCTNPRSTYVHNPRPPIHTHSLYYRNGLSLSAKEGQSEPVEAIRVHVVDLAAAPKEEAERWRKSVLTGSTPAAREETKPWAITLNGNLNANARYVMDV